jgi:DNA-binding transcriptional ArsR family regulator
LARLGAFLVSCWKPGPTGRSLDRRPIGWSASCVIAQQGRQPEAAEFEAQVGVFKLLADPTRPRIIWALLHGEHSVNDLADHVGARPPAVSQHLSKLRLAQLVQLRRDGNRVFYGLTNDHIEHLAAEALAHADHVTGGRHHTSTRTA